MFVKARLNIPIVAATPLPSDTELLQHSSIVSPDFLRNIDDLDWLTLTADIYSYIISCFTLSYRIVNTIAALNHYISDYCNQYKEDPHQGLCCDYYPLYIKGLKDVVMFAPSCLFYALVEEEEDKLVEIRSIRPGWKSTQENKQHWCANTFIAINNELWNNDI